MKYREQDRVDHTAQLIRALAPVKKLMTEGKSSHEIAKELDIPEWLARTWMEVLKSR